jgi:hypothetical protein
MSVSFNKHDEHDHPAPLSYARRGAPSLLDPQAAKSVAQVLHRRHPPLFTSCKRLSRRCVLERGWTLPPPPRKCLQKRARIVRAKRVRTRPFVGRPVLRPASGPRRRRYDEGMMKCPPVQGLPRWRVDPWNASGPVVVWPRNPPRCSEALTARNGAEHPRAPSAVLLPCIAMLPARQQCPALRLETDSSGRALGGPHYGAAAGYARAIPISNALEHSIGRARAGIRE